MTELLDRIRRIETRVTKIGNHIGVDVGGSTPRWVRDDERITIESLNCSLADLMKAVPINYEGAAVSVWFGDRRCATIVLDR